MKSILLICLLSLYSQAIPTQEEMQPSSRTSVKVELEDTYMKVTLATIDTLTKKDLIQVTNHIRANLYKAVYQNIKLPSGQNLKVVEFYFYRGSIKKSNKNNFVLT